VVSVESPTGKPEVRIGVQGKFLVDACDAAGDCDLTVCLSGELDPMVVTPENGDTYVIMPMRV
jgi:DNA polymerase III sliding clamp (beta) subunit (PCNA family)